MFSTFPARMGPTTPPNGTTSGTSKAKSRRRKVARACDSCRLNRIRCDDQQPCGNCRNRGDRCTSTMPWEAHSLLAAKREIERLQERLEELQNRNQNPHKARHKRARSNSSDHQMSLPTPPDPTKDLSSPKEASYTGQGDDGYQVTPEVHDTRRMSREHVEYSEDHHSVRSSLGLSQLAYWMGLHLETASGQSFPISRLGSDGPFLEHGRISSEVLSADLSVGVSQAKERQLLDLFWKGFPWVHSLIDRNEMYHVHESLWNTSSAVGGKTRCSSCLIDIMLALAMQFGSSFLLRDSSTRPVSSGQQPPGQASLAGLHYYARSQRLFMEEQQERTLMSVQCALLSSFYVLNAGSFTMASTSLATAIRMAQILGLHKRTPSITQSSLSARQRRNTWLSLVIRDAYFAIVSDLPPMIQPFPEAQISVSCLQNTAIASAIEGQDVQAVAEIGESLFAGLVKAATQARASLNEKEGDSVGSTAVAELSPLRQVTPGSADEWKAPKLDALYKWSKSIPPELTMPRLDSSMPFTSVNGPVLDLSVPTSFCLQRQRLSLEICFHHLCFMLMRPYIRFKNLEHYRPSELKTSPNSIIGLKHAISLTNMIHQIYTNSDILTGWHLGFRFQWDAASYLLGYLLANPLSPLAVDARNSIESAISAFNIMGKYLVAATSAITTIQDALQHVSAGPDPNYIAYPNNDIVMDTASTAPLSFPFPPLWDFLNGNSMSVLNDPVFDAPATATSAETLVTPDISDNGGAGDHSFDGVLDIQGFFHDLPSFPFDMEDITLEV